MNRCANNKKIVIINQDSGYLMIDIAHAYLEAGYECTLMTGRLVERNKRLDSRVSIQRIIQYKRTSSILRMLTWSIATIQIVFNIMFRYRGCNLLFVSNPPFAFCIASIIRNNYSLLVYDIYPDTLYEMGILSRSSPLILLWERVNLRIYRRAQRIITLTDEMKERLAMYAPQKEIEVVPVWTDNSFLKPIAKTDNPFIAKHNLEGKFVVMYSGNLGYTHQVEVMVDLAFAMQKSDTFHFLIIGDGEKKAGMQKRVSELNLKNCTFMPFLPPSDMPYSLASADLAIVSLGRGASRLSIPSKTFNLLSVGVPILCIADAQSSIASLVMKYNLGRVFTKEAIGEMGSFIELLQADTPLWNCYHQNALTTSLNFCEGNARKIIK